MGRCTLTVDDGRKDCDAGRRMAIAEGWDWDGNCANGNGVEKFGHIGFNGFHKTRILRRTNEA